MSSGYCTKLGTEHCSIIRIVLCGTTFTLLKKRCQCFVDAPMLRSHRRQRPVTDNKEKPQPHWRNFMRDICAEYFMQNPMMIGGPGVVVQIDESMFVRRKHNVGRPVGVQWVFGGIDCNTKEGFLVSVPRRDAATLIPILTRYVRRGTTVVSDLWRAYNMVGANGYNHLTVNHSLHFVDPVTGAHTNEVENMWMLAKRRNKECGTARTLIDTYLIEFMWRLKFGHDPFENILRDIRAVYPQ